MSDSSASTAGRPRIDTSKRTWLIASGCAGAVGGVAVAVPFVSSFQPSEKAKAAGAPVDVIGYPGGRCDGRVADAARAAGFRIGYSTERAPVTPASDPLLLGRIGPSLHTVGALALEAAFTLRKRGSGRPSPAPGRAPS